MSISPLRWARPRTAALAVAGLAVALIVGASVLAILPTPARAATATVPMGGSIYGPFWFCDSAHSGVVCTTTVSLGDTVTWQNTSLVYHTVTECDGVCTTIPGSPIWDSGLVAPSGTFSYQFNSLGTFNYQCNVHPFEMKGQIVVVAAGPTATFTPSPTPTPPPAVGGVSLDPNGGAPSGAGPWPGLGIVAGPIAGALGLLGVLWVTRRRLLR